jgi:integrase
MSDRANVGAPALLEGTRLGLSRLLALPEGTLDVIIAQFRASCSERAVGRGAAEFENWPADSQALAAALYARGLPVHCLPIYCTWLFARLDTGLDLSEAVPYNQFMCMSRAALSSTGLSVARHGSHSFRRGRAGEMFHGGADEPAVAEMLRHRSVASTRPYITDATRMAHGGLAATMRAAVPGR